jgi:lipopolysaccharide/colanic/teichoic acid biosynthesis glycosyltransferase
MGQEICTQQYSTKTDTEAVFFDDTLAISEPSLAVLLGQQLGITIPAVESYKTSVITDVWVRSLDMAGSFIMLAIASPVMLLTALFVRVTSPGPILFKQRRVGKDGKIFVLYKFRTMVNDAEKNTGPVWAAKDDERVTCLGKLLRRTRLDEFPQLFNVLRGDMSLVGPRPERPYFVRRHRALQGIRLAVKPGITGLAQVRGLYDLKPDHKLKYDYLYIQKRSFLLNASILFRTIPIILFKKGW